MPEGKKAAVPAPKPVREEDLYSAKTHLHQPVPVQETSAPSIRATARIRVKIFFIGICYPFLVEHLYHPPKREDIIRE